MTNIAKKSLAVILAVMTVFSCFAICASATDAKIYVKLEAVDEELYIKASAYEDEACTTPFSSKVTFTVSPSATVVAQDDTSVLVINVKSGTKYTVTANAAKDDTLYTGNAAVTMKTKQTAPTSIEADVTTNSITVTKVNGAAVATVKGLEFACVEGTAEPTAYGSDVKFSAKSGTQYTIYARYEATETKLASDPAYITKTTKKASTAKVTAPVVKDVTKTSITVEPVKNAVYSKDGGVKWQDSNIFTGLEADTTYFLALKIVDPEGKEEDSKVSSTVTIKTNSLDVFSANVSSAKVEGIKAGDSLSLNKENSFTAYAVQRSSGRTQYGDTKLVPSAVTCGSDKGSVKAESSTKYTCKITPTSNTSKKVVITYIKYTYKYDETSKKIDWVADGTVTKDISVTVANQGVQFLQKFLTVITNTLPTYINKFIKILQDLGLSIAIFL